MITTKTIAMLGDAYADITVYLGGILAALGEKVLILDPISNRRIDYCIGIPDGIDPQENIITFKSMEYTQLPNLPLADYSVTIVLYGTEVPAAAGDINVFCVAETSEGYHKMYRNEYPQMSVGCMVVRDSIGTIKSDFKRFAKKNGIKSLTFAKFDKDDINARLALEFNHELKVRKTSQTIRGLLYDIIKVVRPETGKSDFDEAMKKAEKGSRK